MNPPSRPPGKDSSTPGKSPPNLSAPSGNQPASKPAASGASGAKPAPAGAAAGSPQQPAPGKRARSAPKGPAQAPPPPAPREPVISSTSPEKRAVTMPRDSGAPEHSHEGRGSSSAHERHHLIARTAYLRAENRGFAPGHELEDWLWAERQHDADGVADADEPTRPTQPKS